MSALNHRWQAVPNILSCGRLALAPAVAWCIVQDDPASAFFLCALAGITDGLDGWIARRYNTSSALGAVLDALADKTLIVAVYVALAVKVWLPLWLVIMVVLRDLVIVGGGVLGYWRRWFAPARPLTISRINTVMQIALAAWLLAAHGFTLHDDIFQDGMVTALLVSVVTCTTAMSAVAYARRWWQEWRRQE